MASIIDSSTVGADAGKRADATKTPREFDETELAFSTLLGGFFTGLSLADLSIDIFASEISTASVRTAFLQWKLGGPPIISHLTLLFALPLPFVLYKFVTEEIMPLFRDNLSREEQWLRVLGATTLFMIFGVVSTVVMAVIPSEKLCFEEQDCDDLWLWHLVVVAVNVILLIIPFMRYHAARAVEQTGKSR
jgi:hypothetical protein